MSAAGFCRTPSSSAQTPEPGHGCRSVPCWCASSSSPSMRRRCRRVGSIRHSAHNYRRSGMTGRSLLCESGRPGTSLRRRIADRRWETVELDDIHCVLRVPPGVSSTSGPPPRRSRRTTPRTAIATVMRNGRARLARRRPRRGRRRAGGRLDSAHRRRPRSTVGAAGPKVTISTGGLATSSTAVRRWRTDAGEAHHILDPRTCRPAVSPWRTVSVAAASCCRRERRCDDGDHPG